MALEYRFAALEVRAADGGQIEGVAMPYGREADIAGVFRESVDAGAFGQIGDVILNLDARPPRTAGPDGRRRARPWKTGPTALRLRADIPEYRADVRDQVKRRILRGFQCRNGSEGRGLAEPGQAHHSSCDPVGRGPCGSPGLRRSHRRDRQAGEGSVSRGAALVAPDRMSESALRRWALRNLVVADGPRAGRPFRIASPPWGDVLDAMDDPDLEQVTIRGSVQSGKTAALIAAGLGHMAAGRSVLIFEPDDKLKRALATRILAWGRACKDEAIREAYEPKRPPFARSTDAGGRCEVISAREGGAGVMRTAEIVIVDELRLFHVDLLGDLVDRMAAYGGKGRLITASSAGYQDECKTTTELEKSDARHGSSNAPSADKRTSPTGRT